MSKTKPRLYVAEEKDGTERLIDPPTDHAARSFVALDTIKVRIPTTKEVHAMAAKGVPIESVTAETAGGEAEPVKAEG